MQNQVVQFVSNNCNEPIYLNASYSPAKLAVQVGSQSENRLSQSVLVRIGPAHFITTYDLRYGTKV